MALSYANRYDCKYIASAFKVDVSEIIRLSWRTYDEGMVQQILSFGTTRRLGLFIEAHKIE